MKREWVDPENVYGHVNLDHLNLYVSWHNCLSWYPLPCVTDRGEFQYKEVKIPADQILANVGQFIPTKSVVFVATDERNRSFFNPFFKRFSKVIMWRDEWPSVNASFWYLNLLL